jgi:hypothetical protein
LPQYYISRRFSRIQVHEDETIGYKKIDDTTGTQGKDVGQKRVHFENAGKNSSAQDGAKERNHSVGKIEAQ